MSSLDNLLADLTSGDESRAEAAASELAQVGESAFPPLESLLDSSDVDQRWWAIRTLAQMDAPHSAWFMRALEDGSSEVRQAAALALAGHPAEESAPLLVQALSDEDGMVGTLAMKALVAVGKPAVPPLLEAFESAPQKSRIHIMHALAEIRDYRAIRVMMDAMEEDSAMLHYWAEAGLERLGLDMVYIKPE